MPGTARDEAERLVAAALGAVSVAARGAADTFATGSAECCVCPVCRVIAAMRDPDPEAAERLASGAGDLAAGVAGILRAFGGTGGRAGYAGPTGSAGSADPGETADAGETAAAEEPRDDDPWRAATRNEPPARRSSAPQPKPMAKKAVRKVAHPAGQAEPAGRAEPADPADPAGAPE